MQKFGNKPVEMECPNCHHKTVVWRDSEGRAKWVCPRCRATTVSKVMSRRHVQLDIYAPEGEVLVQ